MLFNSVCFPFLLFFQTPLCPFEILFVFIFSVFSIPLVSCASYSLLSSSLSFMLFCVSRLLSHSLKHRHLSKPANRVEQYLFSGNGLVVRFLFLLMVRSKHMEMLQRSFIHPLILRPGYRYLSHPSLFIDAVV